MKLHIENMTCMGCARGVTAAIQTVDESAVVKADPASRLVEVETNALPAALSAALEAAGFNAAHLPG